LERLNVAWNAILVYKSGELDHAVEIDAAPGHGDRNSRRIQLRRGDAGAGIMDGDAWGLRERRPGSGRARLLPGREGGEEQ
jgi:hypothetical protein